jgi:diaminopimelate epimerase
MQKFYKYQGTGNDFVLLDQYKKEAFDFTNEQIAAVCDRRFGIGADGFMILRSHPTLDFEMVYTNNDGQPSSMCGNGGRCIVQFAYDLGYISKETEFMAVDGIHHAEIINDVVSLQMSDVDTIYYIDAETFELNTGSPHFVHLTKDFDSLSDIVQYGRSIRYNQPYKEKGINVNLVFRKDNNCIQMATYERGVEDETYSCGTGVTAAALVIGKLDSNIKEVSIETKGGQLKVEFEQNNGRFENIRLIGPAVFVYNGEIKI